MKENYVLYYPGEGRWSMPMTLEEAMLRHKEFPWSIIISLRTAELYA